MDFLLWRIGMLHDPLVPDVNLLIVFAVPYAIAGYYTRTPISLMSHDYALKVGIAWEIVTFCGKSFRAHPRQCLCAPLACSRDLLQNTYGNQH